MESAIVEGVQQSGVHYKEICIATQLRLEIVPCFPSMRCEAWSFPIEEAAAACTFSPKCCSRVAGKFIANLPCNSSSKQRQQV